MFSIGEEGIRIMTTCQEGNFESISIEFIPHRRLGSEGNILCLGTSAFESANLGDQEKLQSNDPERTNFLNEKLHILKFTLADTTTTLPSHGWFPHHSSSDKQQVRNDTKNSKGVLTYFIIKSEKTASKK